MGGVIWGDDTSSGIQSLGISGCGRDAWGLGFLFLGIYGLD